MATQVQCAYCKKFFRDEEVEWCKQCYKWFCTQCFDMHYALRTFGVHEHV